MSHVEIISDGKAPQCKEEMVWPQLFYWGVDKRVYFAEEVGLREDGSFTSSNIHRIWRDGVHPGAVWQIKITAGDGSEYPRVLRAGSALWLLLKGAVGVALHGKNPGYINNDLALDYCPPLPKGTVTTITVSEGKLSAEFEEPKPAFPYRLGATSELVKHNNRFYGIHLVAHPDRTAPAVSLQELEAAVEYIKEHAND